MGGKGRTAEVLGISNVFVSGCSVTLGANIYHYDIWTYVHMQ